MAKKMQRYLAVIDPIRKRFGCNTREAGERISHLLGFEQTNSRLEQELAELKRAHADEIKNLSAAAQGMKGGYETQIKEIEEATAGMKEGFTERLNNIRNSLPEILGSLAGAASMCWDPTPSTAVFDATRAKKEVDEAISKIVI